MNERAQVVKALRPGLVCSLAEIAAACQLEERVVLDALDGLRADGVPIDAVEQNAFCLTETRSPMDRSRLEAALERLECLSPGRFELLDTVDSTSSWLDRKARAGENIHRLACITDFQSAGRGRRGRQWHGAPYCHAMLSMGWEFKCAVDLLSGLSLSLGVVIAHQVRALTGVRVGLKWPNDLWCRNRKLGGILVESYPGGRDLTRVIVGIGLNLSEPGLKALSPDYPVTDLASESDTALPPREDIVATLLAGLSRRLDSFPEEGFFVDQAQFNALDVFLGKEITVSSSTGERLATGGGADESGGYRLLVAGHEEIISAGELGLSLRDNPSSRD